MVLSDARPASTCTPPGGPKIWPIDAGAPNINMTPAAAMVAEAGHRKDRLIIYTLLVNSVSLSSEWAAPKLTPQDTGASRGETTEQGGQSADVSRYLLSARGRSR